MITRKRCPLCTHENRETYEEDLESMNISSDEMDKQMEWPSGTSSKHQRNHMGHYENSSNPRCAICTSPIRIEIESSLHSGEISATEVAESIRCTEAQVIRHVKSHLQPLVQQSAANLIAFLSFAVKALKACCTFKPSCAKISSGTSFGF